MTREVRDIYETAKNATEIERRLRDLIAYMKWKSDETLAAYEHYFEQQHHADTREGLQQKMHTEVQQYLKERQGRKPRNQAPSKSKEMVPSAQVARQFDDEPNLDFLYSLAGER